MGSIKLTWVGREVEDFEITDERCQYCGKNEYESLGDVGSPYVGLAVVPSVLGETGYRETLLVDDKPVCLPCLWGRGQREAIDEWIRRMNGEHGPGWDVRDQTGKVIPFHRRPQPSGKDEA
jgi:hypothetical protein